MFSPAKLLAVFFFLKCRYKIIGTPLIIFQMDATNVPCCLSLICLFDFVFANGTQMGIVHNYFMRHVMMLMHECQVMAIQITQALKTHLCMIIGMILILKNGTYEYSTWNIFHLKDLKLSCKDPLYVSERVSLLVLHLAQGKSWPNINCRCADHLDTCV